MLLEAMATIRYVPSKLGPGRRGMANEAATGDLHDVGSM